MEHLRITVDGKAYDVIVESTSLPTPAAPAAPTIVRSAAAAPTPKVTTVAPAKPSSGEVPSPLAGIVKIVHIAEGAAIKEGDVIITLEAMKMYTPISAPQGGTLSSIKVKEGDGVEEGQILFSIA